MVVVLMEQQSTLGSAAAAAHATFEEVEKGINKIIPTLRLNMPDPKPDDIADLADRVFSKVRHTIIGRQGIVRNLLNLFDEDLKTDLDVFYVSADTLRENGGVYPIGKRFQRLLTTRDGTALVADYRLTAEILGADPSPRGYQQIRRSHEYTTPAAASAPTACVIPALGVHNIVYRDTEDRLHELWRDAAGTTGTTNLTFVAGAPPAAGDPFCYVDTTVNQEIVVYRGADKNVHSLYWSIGPVGHDNLTGPVGAPRAEGNPVGFYNPSTTNHHVAYRKPDGHLHVLWWAGAARVDHADATVLAHARPALGDPAAYLDTTRGRNIVVFRGTDGHVYDIYWSIGDLECEDLSGFAGTPPAADDPVAYYTARTDTHQVTYRTADGQLYELWWVGEAPVAGWSLTAAAAAAPPAASEPAAYYLAATNTKHVIYRSADGHLNELAWAPGGVPVHTDLTVHGLARRAAGRPAAFAVDGPNTQHVAYRSTDREIREIRWISAS